MPKPPLIPLQIALPPTFCVCAWLDCVGTAVVGVWAVICVGFCWDRKSQPYARRAQLAANAIAATFIDTIPPKSPDRSLMGNLQGAASHCCHPHPFSAAKKSLALSASRRATPRSCRFCPLLIHLAL